MKRIAIDIDGVLCEEGPGCDRPYARPRLSVINLVNKAFDDGHMVMIFTARPWGDYQMTYDWLMKHGVRFTTLIMGKPLFDFLLDDRASDSPDKLIAFLEKYAATS